MTTQRLRGVLAPVLTPFRADMSINLDLFVNHCRWLVANDVSLAIFGTNSEAASISADERIEFTESLLERGIPPHRLMPGTGSCSVTEAIRLTKHAVNSGAAGVLVVPPFYFKGVSEDGLFAYYSQIIESVGASTLSVYLYHIPQLTQVPITMGLIERLLKRYPHTVAGCKDSSGNWANSETMIRSFAGNGFDVFPASETFLSRAVPMGAAGCISATVNVNPGGIQKLFASLQATESDAAKKNALQASADIIRNIYQSAPMIPAMKCTLAEFTGDASWNIVRPPLTSLSESEGAEFLERISKEKTSMNAVN